MTTTTVPSRMMRIRNELKTLSPQELYIVETMVHDIRNNAQRPKSESKKTPEQDFLDFCAELNMPPMTNEEIDQVKYDYLMEKYK